MEGRSCGTTVHRVAKSRIRLKQPSMQACIYRIMQCVFIFFKVHVCKGLSTVLLVAVIHSFPMVFSILLYEYIIIYVSSLLNGYLRLIHLYLL